MPLETLPIPPAVHHDWSFCSATSPPLHLQLPSMTTVLQKLLTSSPLKRAGCESGPAERRDTLFRHGVRFLQLMENVPLPKWPWEKEKGCVTFALPTC